MEFVKGPPEWSEGTVHYYCLDNIPDCMETNPANIRKRVEMSWDCPCPNTNEPEKIYKLIITILSVFGWLGHFDHIATQF